MTNIKNIVPVIAASNVLISHGYLCMQLSIFCCKHKTKYLSKFGPDSRCKRNRCSWNSFNKLISNRQFRRMFRMSRDCFNSLCKLIEMNVGSFVFKSEIFIKSLSNSKSKNMHKVHGITTGGFISGEVKVALTLRMLAGGSYLDLALLYPMSVCHVYRCFHYVLNNWICNDEVIKISFYDNLDNSDEMDRVAREFAYGSSSGILGGCIGVLDGWLVKIICPTSVRDGVKNR